MPRERVLHFIAGNLDAALADCTEAIRLEPQSASFYVDCVPRSTASKARPRRPWRTANEGIRLDPNFGWGYRTRGRLYREKGELDKALADINQAVRLDPKNAGHSL